MKIIKKFFNDCILFKKDIHLDKRGTFTGLLMKMFLKNNKSKF